MSTTYHLSKNGEFNICEATKNSCPLGQDRHLVLDSNIKNLDDFWVAFKNAKEGNTGKEEISVSVADMSHDGLTDIVYSVLSDTRLSVEERKKKVLHVLDQSNYNEDAFLAVTEHDDMYSVEEIDEIFFNAPEDRKHKLVFSALYARERSDETLIKMYPYVQQSLDNKDYQGVKTILHKIAEQAKSDEVIQTYLPAIENINLYLKPYTEPELSKFIKNENISAETTNRIFGTMVRAGMKDEFFEGAVVLHARLENKKPDNQYRELIHQRLQSVPTDERPFAGEPEPEITARAQKIMTKVKNSRSFYAYEYTSNHGIFSVYDSYAVNRENLKQEIRDLLQQAKKTRDSSERIDIQIKASGLQGRLKESDNYRKMVTYYWDLVNLLKENNR